mgnify:CR=1 FL=1
MIIMKVMYIPLGIFVDEISEEVNSDIDLKTIKAIQEVEERVLNEILLYSVSRLIEEAINLREREVIIENLSGERFIILQLIYDTEKEIKFIINYKEEIRYSDPEFYINMTKEILGESWGISIEDCEKINNYWVVRGSIKTKNTEEVLH